MMRIEINPQVNKYLINGCMRCKYGATPQCKVRSWTSELEALRQIVLETGLKEEIKWGVPVYTKNGKNIVTINALKASANLGFFKGVLMKDEHKLLSRQGNIQASRIIRFVHVDDIVRLEEVLKSYVQEAIALEESGQKVEKVKIPEPLPEELKLALEEDQLFKEAFYALTPGRQRAYIIHFSQPKQAATRISRIEKHKNQILEGIGLHDKYNSGK